MAMKNYMWKPVLIKNISYKYAYGANNFENNKWRDDSENYWFNPNLTELYGR